MMSNNKIPPTGQSLNYSGAWVDGSNSTFCMNQALFWPWLLPLLKDFSAALTIVPDKPHVTWDNKDHDHPYSTGMRYHFGDSGFSKSDYELVKNGEATWTWVAHSGFLDSHLSSSSTATNPGNSKDYQKVVESSKSSILAW